MEQRQKRGGMASYWQLLIGHAGRKQSDQRRREGSRKLDRSHYRQAEIKNHLVIQRFPLNDWPTVCLTVSLIETDRQMEDGQLRAEANFSWRAETFLCLMVGNSSSTLVTWPQHTGANQWQFFGFTSHVNVWSFKEGMKPSQCVHSALPSVNISDTEQVRPARHCDGITAQSNIFIYGDID